MLDYIRRWSFLGVALSVAGFAADFTVESGTTVTATQNLSDSNDVGLIEAGGTLDTAGFGVNMNSTSGSVTGQVCTNNGTITANGAGIANNAPNGNQATITNNGTITVGGVNSDGISNAQGSSCRITNTGTITMTGSGGYCIENFQATGANIVNSGTLITQAASAFAIENDRSNTASITNSGTITTVGSSSYGIDNFSASSCSISNSGTIRTSGTSAHGFSERGSSSVVNNSGSVVVSGFNADAYFDSGDNNVLINSGTLKSVQRHAVNFSGSNPTLNLNRGSILIGSVESSSAALNVGIEKGLNQRLTINDNSNSFASLNINQPYITVGNTETVATVDPTSFVMQSDMLEDLSDSILDAIYPNREFFLNCQFPCRGNWVSGIATVRSRERDDIETNNSQGGFLIGGDSNFCGDSAFGLFVGGAFGRGEVEDNTASAKTQSYFAGLTYETLACNTFFGTAIAGGYFGSKNRRTVVYNLAPSGEELAQAKANGGMLTAELYAARWLGGPCSFRPLLSGTLRYAGLFLGSYDESGSSADLFVKDRHISLIKPKLEFALTKSGCFYSMESYLAPFIGVAGRFQVAGNEFDSELLGQDLYFETAGPKNLAEFLYGFYGSLSTPGSTLFMNLQGLVDNENSTRFLGEMGINFLF